MSLKAKLISSISAFVLILTIVIVAVWATTQANVSLGGTVNFQATNVYAKVTGTVTGMDSNPTLPTLIFSEGEGASEETDIKQWENLDLVFNTSGTPIEIEVTVENLSDERSLGVSIQNQIASIENIDISITKENEASTSAILSPSTGSGTSTVTFLVTVSLQNPNVSVTDALYDILITLTDESQMKQINVYSNDPSLGTVSGGGLYAPGSTITLSATVNDSSAAIVLGFTADSVDGPMLQFFLGGGVTTEYFTFSLNDIDSTNYYAIFISEEVTSQAFGWLTGDGFSDNPTNYEAYSLLPGADIALLIGVYRNEEGVSIEEYTIPETVMGPLSAPDDPTSVSEMKEYRVIGFFGSINQPSSTYLFDGSSFENLKKVIIPENVTYTPYGGVLRSPTIESYEVDPNNPVFSVVNGNVLFDKLSKTVLSACKGGEIPEGTKVIGEGAFKAHEFESITIPQSVVLIDNGAFGDCRNLTSITIPEGVTSIGNSAFKGCSNLTSVTIEGVTSIGTLAFDFCRSLTSITLPSTLTSIEYGAFSDCSSLTSITIPAGVTSIGSYAFDGCYALAIVYNNSNLTIDGSSSCGYLGQYAKEIVNNGEQPQGSIEDIGNVNYYINETTGEYVVLAPSIPRDSLTEVALLDSTTEISQHAFYGFSGLTEITIPEGVSEIGSSAFGGCYALAIVYNNSSLTIDGSSNCGYLGQYAKEVITNGKAQGRIEESGNVNYYINETTGEYIALAPSISRNLVTQITIAAGAKEINQYAFSDCWALETVIFEENSQLTSIGDYAFYGCSSLTSITIPAGVTSIGISAFDGCSSLTSITIPEGVTSIGAGAFEYCSSLTSITIPAGVTSIGRYAFDDCSSLTSISLPSTLTSIGDYAFSYCSSLTEITINGNISTLGSSVFRECSNLTKLTLGSNVTSIPSDLFTDLTYLTEIVVEAGSSLSAALPTYGTWEKDGEVVTSFSGAGTYTRTDI